MFKKKKIMKKTYISPDMEVVELACNGNLMLLPASGNADPNQEADAPVMLNDDEIFQLFLIH